MAVLEAGSCSSDSTPSLGTSISCGCGPKKINKLKNVCHSTFFFRSFGSDLCGELRKAPHILRESEVFPSGMGGGGGGRAGGQGRRKAQPEALQALAEVMQKTDEGAVVPETHSTEA